MSLAYQALRSGGDACALLNAANEVAVEAFLSGRLPFMQIPDVIAATLDKIAVTAADTIDLLLDADGRARQVAEELVRGCRQ